MKDRYDFGKASSFDEFYLTQKDEKIEARRKARREKAAREADIKVFDADALAETSTRKRYKIAVSKLVVVILALVLALAFVIVAGIKLTDLQVEKKAAEAKLESLKEKESQLQDELREIDSDEYIENAARSELHMIRNGEVMYIVNPDLADKKPTDIIAK